MSSVTDSSAHIVDYSGIAKTNKEDQHANVSCTSNVE